MIESPSQLYFLNWTFWLQTGMAVVCGALLGLERQIHDKPAGVRTSLLICVGSCLFALLPDMLTRLHPSAPPDFSRIAGQVITGVGFLGAGAIIHQGYSVYGLTTAATIWLASGIGLIIGLGYPYTGLVITLCAIATLVPLGWLEHRFFGHSK
ncbi:MAG: MgtC/SapB family protein [Myxococcales bacterium]|nr:MgtC/SapB family protein [Myxococcales bacterium]